MGKTLTLLFIFFLSLFLFSFPLAAKSKKSKAGEISVDLKGNQPYPHHWFEAKGKKGVSAFGQVYQPRPDLAVMEMITTPEDAEIQKIRIRTPEGKVYESKIRRLPWGFMPNARRNYQTPPAESEVKV